MTQRPESDVRLDVEPGSARPAHRPVEPNTFHVALLGDFSGRGRLGAPPPDRLEALHVDRDEVDDVLARLGPRLPVPAPGDEEGGLEVRFRELEDFHPDRLVERVPLFRSIREAAGGGGGGRPRRGEAEAPPAPVEEMLSGGGVLDRIVEGQQGPGAGGRDGGGGDPLREWVDEVVRPHLEEEPDPADSRLAARVEGLLADGMRELLRSPGFRRLEALWRGVDFLVRRVETGPRLTFHLVDVSRAALAADAGLRTLEELLRRGAGHREEPWSVVAALWGVGTGAEELVLLREMARRAAAAGAVLLAGGEPALAGLPSLADAGDRSSWGDPHPLWAAFRREPEARSVGLAIPGFLLRLPYGEETDACEGLELEEIPGEPSAGDYVWGAAALPVVLVLARAFERAGPELVEAVDPDVRSLPLHVHRAGGEPRATPCTEAALTRDDADRMLEAGLMPWAWSRGDDGIRLVRLQSAADPPTGLAGWWRR